MDTILKMYVYSDYQLTYFVGPKSVMYKKVQLK